MEKKSILWGTMAGSYLLALLYIYSFFLPEYRTHGYWQLGFVLCFLAGGELLARALAAQRCRLCPMLAPLSEAVQKKQEPNQSEQVVIDDISVSRCNQASEKSANEFDFVSVAPAPYPKEATFWAICAIGIGLALALYTFFIDHRPAFWQWGDRYSRGIILIYADYILHFMAAYWVACRFGWLCREKTSGWIGADVCNALIAFPFGNFFLRAKLFWQGVRQLWLCRLTQKKAKKPSPVTVGVLVLCWLCFIIAVNLLRTSDTIFADFLAQFRFELSWELPVECGEFFWRFILSLPVGAYFFGLFSRCMRQKQGPSALEAELFAPLKASEALRVVSHSLLAGVLGCFIALYLLYFGVQAEYYLGAFWGNLPERFTFSEYARQGFFELCKLMTLNFVLLFGVAKVSDIPLRQAKALRAAAYALLVTSLVFAATAMAKLVLYIQVYGFTEMRLLAAWAILVQVVAVIFAAKSIHRAQPIVHKVVYFAAASFTLLCFLGT